MKRILVVSFIFPYPINSGASRDIIARIKAMREHGHSVDLVATAREMPDPKSMKFMQTLVDNLWVIQRTRSPSALLSHLPFHYRTRLGLKSVNLSEQYDVTIIESEFVGAILENPKLSARHLVLNVHNDEARLHRALAKDAPRLLDRVIFFAESVKFELYSPKVMSRCDRLWYVSDVELKKAQAVPYRSKVRYLPCLVESDRLKRQSLNSSKVFYAGALSVPINQHGLIWYLENVHPQLLSLPDYELVIAGRTGHASVKNLLSSIKSSKRVSFFPDLDDIGHLYASAAVFINPIQRGAGVKVKTIDAVVSGLPVVTTSVGAEGTGFLNDKHVIIADSADAFSQGVTALLAEREHGQQMVDAAQELVLRNNSPAQVIDLLKEFD